MMATLNGARRLLRQKELLLKYYDVEAAVFAFERRQLVMRPASRRVEKAGAEIAVARTSEIAFSRCPTIVGK